MLENHERSIKDIKLIPADGGRFEVGEEATTRALLWADYLISHARSLYSVATDAEFSGAKIILSRRKKLPDVFTVRDVQRKNWAGLTTRTAISSALELLIEHRYLTEISAPTATTGGRPTRRFQWRPEVPE